MVGAVATGVIEDTNDLHVMNYNKAMQREDKDKWKEAVKEEFDRFRELKVFKTVPISAKSLTVPRCLQQPGQ